MFLDFELIHVCPFLKFCQKYKTSHWRTLTGSHFEQICQLVNNDSYLSGRQRTKMLKKYHLWELYLTYIVRMNLWVLNWMLERFDIGTWYRMVNPLSIVSWHYQEGYNKSEILLLLCSCSESRRNCIFYSKYCNLSNKIEKNIFLPSLPLQQCRKSSVKQKCACFSVLTVKLTLHTTQGIRHGPCWQAW